uniref:Cytidine/deoxycytidylate deaminase family protein n=1 Tax=Paulinella longichromatophora TaxID=1708747 RepID=A0A2H4ZNK4_9EUKA|nr:cytidine/deoxycytidylate deaminase family protein [Paulinella longichromatophora]
MKKQLSRKIQEEWMSRLLRNAYDAGTYGEVPIAAVILNESGQCIGWGRNCREKDQNPLGHAEIIALRQASYLKKSWRFNECTMLVTLEPCPMCAGALLQARINHIIYGASDYKRGGFGGVLDLSKNSSAHHKIEITRGVKSIQSCQLLETWFRRRRRV